MAIIVGVDDLNFANRIRSSEVTDAADDVIQHGMDCASGSFIHSAQLPPDQHIAADRNKMVLVPRTVILGLRVSFFEVRLIMNRPREADLGENEGRQFTTERFK